MTHIDTVHKVYRDFAAGNAAAVLDAFVDDIEFKLAESHPYRGAKRPLRGKQAVAADFFAIAGPEWDGWTIGVAQIVEGVDAVVVEGRYAGFYKPTGRRMDVEVCHVWRFRGDRIASFHQYVDTAALRRVMARDEA
jgi:ketosteroid isomerase-like protein